MKIKWFGVLPAVLLLASVASPALAQGSAASSITGVVIDVSGGVIPGASVVVKSESTGAEFTAVSNSNGAFTVPALAVGNYTVTVTLQGFKQAVLKGVTVTSGVPGTVRAVLEVGGMTETVEVSGASEVIQTTSAAASTTINTKSITSLPVGTRSALDFTQFLPGVQTASSVRNSTVNGLPQSSISITLDGVNIQDNTLKTTDGFFAIVSPRLDAIEEVTLTSAAQGADSTGQGAVQIRFTTRSGSNAYVGSAYHFYQSDKLNTNTYANIARGLPKGPLTLHQPGFRQGGPVAIPGLYDGRGKMFFFVNFEAIHQPSTITTNSTLMLPDAQNGIFRYNGGPGGGINLYALAAANGFTATPDSTVAKLLADIRNSTKSGGVLSEITGNLNAERYTFQQPAGGPVYCPTVRMDYNLNGSNRLSGTWYRQRFTDTSFDTTNSRQPTWPGFPAYGTQGSFREAYTGSLRSTLSQNLVNEAQVAYSGAPVQFGPSYSPRCSPDRWPIREAALGINAAVGITSAGPSFTPSGRNTTTLTVANTVNWLKGSHSSDSAASSAQYDVWLDTYWSAIGAVDRIRHADRRPGAGHVHIGQFPGQQLWRPQHRGCVVRRAHRPCDQCRRDRPPRCGLWTVHLPGRQPRRGALAPVRPLHAGQLARSIESVTQPGRPIRVAVAIHGMNSSYSTATLDDLWGVSGYVRDASSATRLARRVISSSRA